MYTFKRMSRTIGEFYSILKRKETVAMTSHLTDALPVPGDAPLVTLTNLGTLRGSTTVSAFSSRKILQFLSIKYGETTAGEFRFKAPRKATAWDGIRDVSQYGLPCPQLKLGAFFANQPAGIDFEDCLKLSVYTHELSGSKPVMVFVHGGGFYEGSGANHTPEFLLEKDVVLVVVQYRLGPLGFLSLKNEQMPGNAGLLDIKLALEWVKDNIGSFGGDATNVTLFGQSAGAAAVSALMYSPLVPEGLFHKVILQSGGSSSPWVWDKDPIGHVREIVTIAGCDPNADLPHKIECLREMDIWKLLKAFIEHKNRTTSTKGLSEVGGNRLTVGDFHGLLPEKPWELLKMGKIRRNLPMMAGVVKHEGTFLLTTIYDGLKNIGQLDNEYFIKYGLLERTNRIFGVDDSTGTLAGYQIRTLFSPSQLSSGNFEEMADGLIDLTGTMLIKAALLREAQANGQVNPNGTFLYTFDYQGEKTRFGYGADTSHYPFAGGVHHSDDLLYLFPHPPGEPTLNEKDAKMARMMVDLWTSFATSGVPKSDLTDVEWTTMKEYAGPYLHIDEKPRLGTNFYEEFSVVSDEKQRFPEQ
ncbi:glutactin-like isoform X2 [Wyeomyia smithii]|uniref:glutactin-like isoform X2 n=1 Tax=Wyeomyia smithii TaxID=174621 RepID=UPI002467AF5D|nr:glutactin-like isoform X2 [Wyeomyia smithii]